jgi:hypothetical protein
MSWNSSLDTSVGFHRGLEQFEGHGAKRPHGGAGWPGFTSWEATGVVATRPTCSAVPDHPVPVDAVGRRVVTGGATLREGRRVGPGHPIQSPILFSGVSKRRGACRLARLTVTPLAPNDPSGNYRVAATAIE